MTELLTATDLEQWSERNDARGHLPTLVRRLILATAAPDTLRMPAAEGVGLPGLDGMVTSASGVPPFLPPGRSVWELGTSREPQDKAQRDYRTRVGGSSRSQRSGVLFVFVTSRRWPSSKEWIDRRLVADDGWAGIRVLDAEDLAAWLALCPGVHRWLATEQLGRDPDGVIGLRDWFRNWAERTQPPIPSALLLSGRDDQVHKLRAQLLSDPTEQVVASASRDESVAFLAACLSAEPPKNELALLHLNPPNDGLGDALAVSHSTRADTDQDDAQTGQSLSPVQGRRVSRSQLGVARAELEALLERTLVVEDARAWRRVAGHERPTVLVPMFEEPELGDALRAGHQVVIPRANRRESDPLPRLHRQLAREVWIDAGLDHDRADEYARAARRSLTSLRRRIGRPGWLRQPPWASDSTANTLAPLLLVGAWADDSPGDLEVLGMLSGRGWRATARNLSTLTSGEDAPLLRRDRRWEFADPIDAWDALSHALIAEDLDTFQSVAPTVLSETDPAPTLSTEARIAASFSEAGLPRRVHSGTLRRGIATTLSILGAVVGETELPGSLTGQQRASQVVRELLQDAGAETWRSVADLLPLLAEASPESFLSAVEHSLDRSDLPVMSLFDETPDETGLGGRSAHAPLLWGLEILAWSPELLSRVAVVLGRLADRDPGGRLGNRPGASLAAAMHLAIPQGAVNMTTRAAAINALRTVAPAAAWRLVLDLARYDRGMILVTGPKFREWSRPPRPSLDDLVDALDSLAARIAEDAGSDPDRLAAAIALVDQFREPGRLQLIQAVENGLPHLADEGRRLVLGKLANKVSQHRRYPDASWAMSDQALRQLEALLDTNAFFEHQPDDVQLFSYMPFRRGLNLHPEDPDLQVLSSARREAVGRRLRLGLSAVFALAEESEQPAAVGGALASITRLHDDEVLENLAADHSGFTRWPSAWRHIESSRMRAGSPLRP